MTRLANICPRPTHLELSGMLYLSETGRLSLVNLFRQIILNNPPIQALDMDAFSRKEDKVENIGELVLESLVSSRIDSIKYLNLCDNGSWF